jgi:hypothetical protein
MPGVDDGFDEQAATPSPSARDSATMPRMTKLRILQPPPQYVPGRLVTGATIAFSGG